MTSALKAAALFPLGLYGVSNPQHLGAIHHAGFSTVVAGGDAASFERLGVAAGMQGMTLLTHPRPDAKGHPVLAWYLADEPDVTGMTEEQLVALDRKTKKEMPGPPTTFVVGDGGDAPCFAKAADILMVDWYPVPHHPLNSIGDHVRWTVDAAKGRPVWAVIQAYDWRDQVQRNPGPRIGRFPTAAEIRFMSYLAIVRGAQGLFYFQFGKPGGKTLIDFPDQWFALTSTVHEIAQLAPGLANGTPLPAKPNAIPGFLIRAWRDDLTKEETVVLVNDSPDKAATVPLILKQDRWTPLAHDPAPGELAAPSSVVVLRRRVP